VTNVTREKTQATQAEKKAEMHKMHTEKKAIRRGWRGY
jgi:hypothetical protein